MANKFETIFLVSAFIFQLILITHFALRKWHYDVAIHYGPAVYFLGIPAGGLSAYLLLGGASWTLWTAGFIYLIWGIYGYWIEYIRAIQWRDPVRWSVMGPYITLYLATVMFYWWPLALIYKPLWNIYALLFIISTILNFASHKKRATRNNAINSL